jgi:phosphoadenosine phosphosulfate reductase
LATSVASREAPPLVEADALARKSAELEGAAPEEILAFAFATYPRIALSTAFGVEGCVLIDMAVRLRPDVPVFTVDTDYLFPESLALRERMRQRYGLRLEVLSPRLTIAEQEARHGVRLYESDPDLCCSLRKVEPTKRAIQGLDAWISGIRRDQAPSRSATAILERYEHDDGRPYVKVSPLARWTRKEVWSYVTTHDVPYSELHDRGYESIGCWPCTRPVTPGEGEREGRWAGRGKTECGIHTFGKREGR